MATLIDLHFSEGLRGRYLAAGSHTANTWLKQIHYLDYGQGCILYMGYPSNNMREGLKKMNKIKRTENIFPFLGKTRGLRGGIKYYAALEKNQSCAKYIHP